MTVYKGRKTNPRRVDCCAVGCEGETLDRVIKDLNADGWNIRQIFQEMPSYYRVFAQREVALAESTADGCAEKNEAL
jgi:hypothetical protein